MTVWGLANGRDTMTKSLLVILLTVILVAGYVFFETINFTAAQTATYVSGAIDSNTTWTRAKSPYTLTGPMFVNMNIILTIEPGVTVNLNGHVIQVNGILCARGTTVRPITFNDGKIVFTKTSSGWNAPISSGSILENTIFSISKLEIKDASPKIVNNAFKGSSILVTGEDPHFIGGSPIITQNTLIGVTSTGRGISISGNNNASITDNRISNWGEGIATDNLYYANSSYPQITNNLLTNNTNAIKVELLMRDWVGNNFPIIIGNTIVENSIGVNIIVTWQADGDPDQFLVPTIIQDNNIYHNSGGNLIGQCKVDATNNYWGSSSMASINPTIAANYQFVPFLNAPNPYAPDLNYNPNPALISTSVPASTTTPRITLSPAATPTRYPALPSQNLPLQNSGGSHSGEVFPWATVAAVVVTLVIAVVVVVMLKSLFSKNNR